VNGVRYRAYRTARASIAVSPLSGEERALLLDAVEGMLLARAHEDDDLRESELQMWCVLHDAVADERLEPEEAEALREEIEQSGPRRGFARHRGKRRPPRDSAPQRTG
jgi:hypothetical protein